MSLVRYSHLFTAMLATAGVPLAMTAADAQQKITAIAVEDHDGVYSVDIVTEQGACDRAYHWTIAVNGGRVSSSSDAVMQATGHIDRRGVVSLAFRRDNNVAHVAGKVKGKSGSGTWSSPTMQCGGSWRAARQG
jgi:hypothetical protein